MTGEGPPRTPARLRRMTSSAAAGRPLCSRVANDVPRSACRCVFHVIHLAVTQPVERQGPPTPEGDFKSDLRFASANMKSFVAFIPLPVRALRRLDELQ